MSEFTVDPTSTIDGLVDIIADLRNQLAALMRERSEPHLTMKTYLLALDAAGHDGGRLLLRVGFPYWMIEAKARKAERRGWIDYGTHVFGSWLNDDGRDHLDGLIAGDEFPPVRVRPFKSGGQ